MARRKKNFPYSWLVALLLLIILIYSNQEEIKNGLVDYRQTLGFTEENVDMRMHTQKSIKVLTIAISDLNQDSEKYLGKEVKISGRILDKTGNNWLKIIDDDGYHISIYTSEIKREYYSQEYYEVQGNLSYGKIPYESDDYYILATRPLIKK